MYGAGEGTVGMNKNVSRLVSASWKALLLSLAC